jgi:hypothetical protein
VKQLVSLLPRASHPYTSPSAPMIAFDRGYGKMNMINFFLEKQFKIITVCTAVGSGHPCVSESAVKAYVSRIQNDSNSDHIASVESSLELWTVHDDNNILRGPAIEIAVRTCDGGGEVRALTYRDVFDKKSAKNFTFLCCWVWRFRKCTLPLGSHWESQSTKTVPYNILSIPRWRRALKGGEAACRRCHC